MANQTNRIIESIVTEVNGLFINKEVKVKFEEQGPIKKTSLKQAYESNLLIECNFPLGKYIRAQQAFISRCGNVFPDEAHYNTFLE